VKKINVSQAGAAKAMPPAGARPFLTTFVLVAGLGAAPGCNQGDAARGAVLFGTLGCSACHRIGAGPQVQGPDLQGVGSRYDRRTLESWLRDPESVYAEKGRRPLNPGFPPMPVMTLNEDQRRDLVAFLETLRGSER
jgi:cytochrome c2